ncbi:MAG: HD domain-containing protein, partial [Erysipelotrichaceae bacterium]|nr:HD domain-containing protein [Erysipelotrichaceae bacterium]
DGKLWDVKPDQQAVVVAGKVIDVIADVIMYRNNLQLKVIDVKAVDQSDVDMGEFIQGSPIPMERLRQTIYGAIDNIDNFEIKAIVSALYNKYDKEIFSSPAAAKNHHEFYGGLATHITGMLNLANTVCDLYPYLDRDLLCAGVLLHDIGKIKELGGVSVTEYTLEGKLLGHISISQTMVQETADELGIEGETVTLLRHMVLSHHGQYEYGSPVLPSTLEAEALHYIDDFDARMTMIKKEIDKTKEGEFTGRIFSLDNRMFYKPKK